MTGVKLKVLTLNCWGIFLPVVCQNKNERIAAIGDELVLRDFDVVFLQEIWSQNDYIKLKKKLSGCLPYAHYFKSGIVGSGLCLFSRHRIVSTSQLRFSVNGYAHKFFCGDWYGQKSVGLAKLLHQPSRLNINAYITHIHAQYSDDGTQHSYDSHRCLQAYQLACYVKETSADCDVVVMGGDFNITPYQVGYDLIKSIACLEDSWRVQANVEKAMNEEFTCNSPDNPYTSPHSTLYRIDYLFHRGNSGHVMNCVSCDLDMKRIKGSTMAFSDHEGVAAVYEIRKSSDEKAIEQDKERVLKNLKAAQKVLEAGVNESIYYRRIWFCLFFVCVLVLVVVSTWHVGLLSGVVSGSNSVFMNLFIEIFKLSLVIFSVFCFIHSFYVLTQEIHNTHSVIAEINNDQCNFKSFKKQN